MVTQFPTGPDLILSQTRGLWSPPGPHLYLVNLVYIWASLSPGDFVPHLDLIAVDPSFTSPGTGDSDRNWASPRSGDSGSHLRTIMIWILSSTPEPHLDMKTLVPIWMSPRPSEYGTPLGLN